MAERLVEQKCAGPANDGTSQRHALLLPSGKLTGQAVENIFESEQMSRAWSTRSAITCFRTLSLRRNDWIAATVNNASEWTESPPQFADSSIGCSEHRDADKERTFGRPSPRRVHVVEGVHDRSPMAMVPAVASSKPAINRNVVVLPQPDGPTRTISSPSATCTFSSRTASTPFG